MILMGLQALHTLLMRSSVLLGMMLMVPVAFASPEDGRALEIAKRGACMGCHASNKKIVGPSFHSVAEKYKGNPKAIPLLAAKVRTGGSGSWGVIPMPANTSLSDPDLALVIAWVLQGAPDP